ncbi:hypothetical protein M404DRAFT_35336 [Pisolithus tinctorius Marx 270]|uniref:Uncharacterized protein n=1 Tax=Pisolithus tinctorius Marx 270 TaxID=870435 RepID=A0A0C3IAN9_PISTI|nr:hypothetical protein M404DRAFT_35336 [Pisolithus tinctorius Marx 270]
MSRMELDHAESEMPATMEWTFSEAQVASMIQATQNPFFAKTPSAEMLTWWYAQEFRKTPEFPIGGKSKGKKPEATKGSIHAPPTPTGGREFNINYHKNMTGAIVPSNTG